MELNNEVKAFIEKQIKKLTGADGKIAYHPNAPKEMLSAEAITRLADNFKTAASTGHLDRDTPSFREYFAKNWHNVASDFTLQEMEDEPFHLADYIADTAKTNNEPFADELQDVTSRVEISKALTECGYKGIDVLATGLNLIDKDYSVTLTTASGATTRAARGEDLLKAVDIAVKNKIDFEIEEMNKVKSRPKQQKGQQAER